MLIVSRHMAVTYFLPAYPRGTVVEPHAHPTRNCGVIIRGELPLICNGKETRYGVGHWYSLDANVQHVARFEVDTSEIEFWFK